VCGVPISWRSKAHCSIALSSSEEEWVAGSEAAKEVKVVLQLLQSIKINVKLPIIVCVDNVGAICMTKNITTTGCSKHVDMCYKFVTEYIEDGIIKVIFVELADNDSGIMTINIGSEFHSKHGSKMISKKEIL
jgi:hypothetical protein